MVVAHRVVMNQIVEGWFETKGDANEAADLSKIPYDALISIVTYHIPMLGSLTTTIGKLYMVCFAACGAMLNILAGRMREKSRGDLQRELAEELRSSKGAFRMTDDK